MSEAQVTTTESTSSVSEAPAPAAAAPETPTTSAPETPAASSTSAPERTTAEIIAEKIANKAKQPAAAAQTPQPASTTEKPAVIPSDPAAAAAAPQAPAWTPNYKYKAYGQEQEIPELFRGLIKDAATEEEVRKVFNKAGGFDGAISRYNELKTQYDATKEAQTFYKDWNHIKDLYTKVDPATKRRTHLGEFFHAIGVDDDALFQYARERMEFNALSDEQKAVHNQRIAAAKQNWELSQRVSELEADRLQAASQTREAELATELTKPGIAEVVKAYDASKGPGAFRNLVVATGQRYSESFKQDIGVQDVVGSLVAQFQPFLTASQPAQPATNMVVAPAPKPVIPTIAGGTTTPARKVFKSTDDLRKFANSLGGDSGQQAYRGSR